MKIKTDAFMLKIIAIFTMTIDHIGLYITDSLYLRFIGRISFPIFAFLVSEGYRHTRDVNSYIKRLTILFIISQIPYSLLTQSIKLNVIFTLILGVISIYLVDKRKNYLFASCIIILSYFSKIIDYGGFGISIIVLFYFIYPKNKMQFLLLSIISTFLNWRGIEVTLYLFWLMSLPIITKYSGEKGINDKRLFYYYYPLHIIVILIFAKIMV